MKKANSSHYYLSIVMLLIGMSSCEKQVNAPSSEQEKQKAIQEIRNIIGTDGAIKILDSNTNSQNNNQSESIGSVKSSIRKLSIDEFRNVYNAFKRKNIIFTTIEEGRVDSVNSRSNIKSNSVVLIGEDTYDILDGYNGNESGFVGPRPAGIYRSIFHSEALQYYVYGYVDGNNPALAANLNVEFKTDRNGMVTGAPHLYFSGLRFFSWNPIASYPINYNAQNYTSSFYFSGEAEFLLGYGNSIFGMGGSVTFKVTINMDENANQIVRVETVDFTNISN